MRRWIILLAALAPAFAAFADEQRVRDVDITVTLIRNGNAVIRERWDVSTGDEITEWYLPRENLGDIRITDFVVYSDNERLADDGEWDVDRSRRQKAGKYGIVHKQDGVELCWGIGEYGDHVFEPVYVMTRAVKSLNDYDMLHLQLVTDELAAPPKHVRVRIRAAGQETGELVQLDTTNTRVWGFGFHGTAAYEDGAVVFESTEPFGYYSSVIALLRFEKGLFDSPSVQERDFQAVLDRAMEGADFGPRGDEEEEEEDPVADGIAFFFAALTLWFMGRKALRTVSGKPSRREKRQLLGQSAGAPINWYREIPMDGDLIAADYALSRLGEDRKRNALASAEILRMIYNGYLDVRKDASGKVEITFSKNQHGKAPLDSIASDLRSMMLEASGKDHVLQDTEFSAWSRQHSSKLVSWTEKMTLMGKRGFRDKKWMSPSNDNFTAEGQKETRQLLGFKKYLSDFTLSKERETAEVHLWQEYLVYGTLFGIADKVAKQLKDIDPVLFERTVGYDYTTFSGALNTLDSLARAITSANRSYSSSTYSGGGGGSWGGFGGGTSFGGGGGFSGGGHGGGGR
ncbi:MAG: DUF2207 domain-containing protein [Bacteroidales bacterium]|nr:DUF2207 domain-containing protein [Bacteroidales bacterium]